METATENSVPMPAMLNTDLVVAVMDKRSFHNEAAFQVTMHLARTMLLEKLITEKEYRAFEQEMLLKYQPFSGDLYTC